MADLLDATNVNEFQRLRSRHNQWHSTELGPVASSLKFLKPSITQETQKIRSVVPVVQKFDSAIYRINRYSVGQDSITQTNCVIHWIVIDPVCSAIHLLNNWDLVLAFESINSN